jgi:hypothetical protein
MTFEQKAIEAAGREGLRAIWLVPSVEPSGEERMAGHVIALEYDPVENDDRPFRLLWEGHEMSERAFFTLPADAVQLVRFS